MEKLNNKEKCFANISCLQLLQADIHMGDGGNGMETSLSPGCNLAPGASGADTPSATPSLSSSLEGLGSSLSWLLLVIMLLLPPPGLSTLDTPWRAEGAQWLPTVQVLGAFNKRLSYLCVIVKESERKTHDSSPALSPFIFMDPSFRERQNKVKEPHAACKPLFSHPLQLGTWIRRGSLPT